VVVLLEGIIHHKTVHHILLFTFCIVFLIYDGIMEILGRDGENTLVQFSLQGATNQIIHALQAGWDKEAMVVYWLHGANIFDYLFPEDGNYWREINRLKEEIRTPNSTVSSVAAGAPLVVGTYTLYPIDVVMPTRMCYVYSLLRRDGDIAHAEFTPYLFKTVARRDQFLRYINQN
jgi:hypothetical protein